MDILDPIREFEARDTTFAVALALNFNCNANCITSDADEKDVNEGAKFLKSLAFEAVGDALKDALRFREKEVDGFFSTNTLVPVNYEVCQETVRNTMLSATNASGYTDANLAAATSASALYVPAPEQVLVPLQSKSHLSSLWRESLPRP